MPAARQHPAPTAASQSRLRKQALCFIRIAGCCAPGHAFLPNEKLSCSGDFGLAATASRLRPRRIERLAVLSASVEAVRLMAVAFTACGRFFPRRRRFLFWLNVRDCAIGVAGRTPTSGGRQLSPRNTKTQRGAGSAWKALLLSACPVLNSKFQYSTFRGVLFRFLALFIYSVFITLRLIVAFFKAIIDLTNPRF